jgi:hypothetical protein
VTRPRRTPFQNARFRDQLELGSDYNVVDSHPNASNLLVRFGRFCMSSYGLTRMRFVNPARGAESTATGDMPARPERLPPEPEAALSLVKPAWNLVLDAPEK